jgi:phosphoserine phosphatase
VYFVSAVGAAKIIFLDCDSTLSAIEGIDELARLRGPDMLAQVAAMTRDAMDGKTPVEQIFARRLDIIRPGRADLAAVGRLYLEHVEPTARNTVATLRAAGWTPVILSGGFGQAIKPLAEFLGIARVEAVELHFDAHGSYAGFDGHSPMTRSGGKPRRIDAIKRELSPSRTVMVGDGASDLEAKPVVDLLVGYGGFVERAAVRAGAAAFIHRLDELPALLINAGL